MSIRLLVKLGLGLVLLAIALLVALVGYVLHVQRAYRLTPDSHDLKARIAKLGNQYISKRPNGALVIAVWQQNRGFTQGFGRISATNANPPDAETLFEIGSITKVFTALTLAKMAQDGMVDLNAPISRYLPQTVVSPRKNGRELTLLNLATHTSGLPRLPDNFDAVSKEQSDPYASYHASDLYQSLAQVRLATMPGKTSEYSNYGMGLLGHLLALKSGKPYEDLIKETICLPLGLTNTTISLTGEQKRRLTLGHNPKGELVPNWTFDVMAPAGALRSNADDLLKFLAVNLHPESSPLSAALVEAQKTHLKEFCGGVGLAWQIDETIEQRTVHWHNGGTGGYVSYLGFDKAAGVGVVLLSNYGDSWGDDDPLDEMGAQILKWEPKISYE